MYVAQLCARTVATIRANDEIITAAQVMRERHVGYLVVVGPARTPGAWEPVGVLTDRDIVIGVVARGIKLDTVTVGDVMTAKPIVVCELDSVDVAVREMRRIGVRRIPVVDQQGELKGVLSLDDVLDATSSELRDLAGAVRNAQRIEGTLRT